MWLQFREQVAFVDTGDGLAIIECNPRTTDGVPAIEPPAEPFTPSLYSFLAFCHHERLSLQEHRKLQVAMYEDVSWDGEAISGMTASQAVALQRLRG